VKGLEVESKIPDLPRQVLEALVTEAARYDAPRIWLFGQPSLGARNARRSHGRTASDGAQ